MKSARGMTALSVLALSLFLISCASNKPRVVVVKPPVERLTCRAEPAVPATYTDASVAGYIADLASAGQDCRTTLGWVRDWAAGL